MDLRARRVGKGHDRIQISASGHTLLPSASCLINGKPTDSPFVFLGARWNEEVGATSYSPHVESGEGVVFVVDSSAVRDELESVSAHTAMHSRAAAQGGPSTRTGK